MDITYPGRFLGFHHPSGEKHITDSNAWVACPGKSSHSMVFDSHNDFPQAKTTKTVNAPSEKSVTFWWVIQTITRVCLSS